MGGLLFISTESMAQFSSSFQSAESVGKGRFETTILYSSLSAGYEGERDGIINDFGFFGGFGLSDKTEIRVRYDKYAFKESDGQGLNNIMAGPKFSSESGNFAFYLPVGLQFEKDSESTWMSEPSFILSFPLGKAVQINATPSFLFPIGEDLGFSDGLLKINLGLGVKLQGDWIIRPEWGLMYFAESIGDGHFMNLGLGISKRFGGE